MQIALKNTIHSAALDFNFKSLQAEDLKENEWVDWAKSNILESIDYHANQLISQNEIVQIPFLEIDIDLLVKDKFFKNKDNDEIRALISEKIKSSLEKAISKSSSVASNQNSNSTQRLTVQQYRAFKVLRFIQTGQLEHYISPSEWLVYINSFFEELKLKSEVFFLWKENIQNEFILQRFLKLKSIEETITFLSEFLEVKDLKILLTDSLSLLNENSTIFKTTSIEELVANFLLIYFSSKSIESTFIHLLAKQLLSTGVPIQSIKISKSIHSILLNELGKRTELSKESVNVQTTSEKSNPNQLEMIEEGAFVSQAGLVLLAPFLPAFLKDIGYLNSDGEWTQQQQLPILLHYIATGELETPEWNLTLPKILSGLKPGQHCDTLLSLNSKINLQIDELLASVVEHWSALQNTSTAGLKETFLAREGRLKQKNGFYYLYIKEKAFDILLSFIPWNYSLIKLEWMQKILFVEWKSNS
jgi:hypothetical protein